MVSEDAREAPAGAGEAGVSAREAKAADRDNRPETPCLDF